MRFESDVSADSLLSARWTDLKRRGFVVLRDLSFKVETSSRWVTLWFLLDVLQLSSFVFASHLSDDFNFKRTGWLATLTSVLGGISPYLNSYDDGSSAWAIVCCAVFFFSTLPALYLAAKVKGGGREAGVVEDALGVSTAAAGWLQSLAGLLAKLHATVLFVPLFGMSFGFAWALLTDTDTWGGTSFAAAFFLPMSLAYAAAVLVLVGTQYDVRADSKTLLARPHSRFEIVHHLARCVLVIFFVVLDAKLALLAIVVLASVGLTYYVYMLLPYYRFSYSRLRMICMSVVAWTSVCAFVAEVQDSEDDTAASLLLYLVTPLVAGSAFLACRARRAALLAADPQRLANPYEIDLFFRFTLENLREGRKEDELLMRQSDFFSDDELDQQEQLLADDGQDIELGDYGAEEDGPASDEEQPVAQRVKSRLGDEARVNMHEELAPEDEIMLAEDIYGIGLERFGRQSIMHTLAGVHFFAVARNLHVGLAHLERAMHQSPRLDERFQLLRLQHVAQRWLGRQSARLLAYIKYNGHIRVASLHDALASIVRTKFWIELSSDSPDLHSLHDMGALLKKHIEQATENFEAALAINSNRVLDIKRYAHFSEQVGNDPERALRLFQMASQAEVVRDQRRRALTSGSAGLNQTSLDLFDEDIGVIEISGEPGSIGIIKTASNRACRIFGFSRAGLIGRNISILLPSPFSEHHDGWIENYLQTGVGNVIGQVRSVFGLHKSGHIFPVQIDIWQSPVDPSRASFIGGVKEVQAKEHNMFIDETGRVMYWTTGCISVFEALAEADEDKNDPDRQVRKVVRIEDVFSDFVERQEEYYSPQGVFYNITQASGDSFRIHALIVPAGMGVHIARVTAKPISAVEASNSSKSLFLGALRQRSPEPSVRSRRLHLRGRHDSNVPPRVDSPMESSLGIGDNIGHDSDDPWAGMSRGNSSSDEESGRNTPMQRANLLQQDVRTSSPRPAPHRQASPHPRPSPSPSGSPSPNPSPAAATQRLAVGAPGSQRSGDSTQSKILATLRQAISGRASRKGNLKWLRNLFMVTIALVVSLMIASYAVVNSHVSSYGGALETLELSHERHFVQADIAYFVRMVELMRVGKLPTTDDVSTSFHIDSLADRLDSLNTRLYDDMSSSHRQYFIDEAVTVKVLGSAGTETQSLFEVMDTVASMGHSLFNKSADQFDQSSNDNVYFLVQNDDGPVFDRLNRSSELFRIAADDILLDARVLELGFMASGIGLVFLLLIFAFRPAVERVTDTKVRVLRLFVDAKQEQNDRIRMQVVRAADRLQNLNLEEESSSEAMRARFGNEAGHVQRELQSIDYSTIEKARSGVGADALLGDDDLDRSPETKRNRLSEDLAAAAAAAGNQPSFGVIGNSSTRQAHRNRRSNQNHGRRAESAGAASSKAMVSHEKRQFYTKVSILLLLCTAYFFGVYAWTTQELVGAEARANEVNWTGRRRFASKRILSYAREFVATDNSTDDRFDRQSLLWAERQDLIERALLFGASWMEGPNLEGSSRRYDEHDDLSFLYACYEGSSPGCATFHNGIMTHGLSAVQSEYQRLAERIVHFSNYSSYEYDLQHPNFVTTETLELTYLREAMAYSSQLYRQEITDSLDVLLSGRVWVLLAAVAVLVVLFQTMYLPVIAFLQEDILRTKSMLLFLPSDLIHKVQSIKEFVRQIAQEQ